jgi:DNA invertase Pin-like site-specific DNA recombinase
MVSLTRDSQMDKAKETLRDVVSYADDIIRDERIRADIRAAVGHGSKAGARVKEGVNAGGGITTRLASDKKLRKDLRRMLDDLDSASERMRRRKSHRARNVLLIVASAGAALAVIPSVRQWLGRQRTSEFTTAMPGDATA